MEDQEVLTWTIMHRRNKPTRDPKVGDRVVIWNFDELSCRNICGIWYSGGLKRPPSIPNGRILKLSSGGTTALVASGDYVAWIPISELRKD